MNYSASIGDLNEAIHRRNLNKINKILSNNPSLLKDKNFKFLPLMNAVFMKNNIKVIELLIKHGADVDSKYPLEIALREGTLECIEVLLKNGAKLGHHRLKGEFIDVVFSRTDGLRKEVLLKLFEFGLNPKYINAAGETLLNRFLWGNFCGDEPDVLEITKILLDYGVPINKPDDEGLTPLSKIICSDLEIELITLLVSRGAEIKKSLPLFDVAEHNSLKVMDFLLSKGVSIHTKNHLGRTALHQACSNKGKWENEKAISFLIQKGAKISEEDNEGNTPFSLLHPEKYHYEESIIAMIKEFAKLSFEDDPISKKDMDLIQANTKAQDHFEKCKNELSQMSNAKLQPFHSIYSILKNANSIKKLANLAKNKEFVSRFEENLKSLFYYKNDLQKIWEDALRTRDISEKVYSRLNSLFSDFLPSIVIKILSENLKLEDLPLETVL